MIAAPRKGVTDVRLPLHPSALAVLEVNHRLRVYARLDLDPTQVDCVERAIELVDRGAYPGAQNTHAPKRRGEEYPMSVSPEEFEFAEAWRPEAGELIEGKVVEITTRGGGEYGDYPIVTLELDSGEHRALHLFHTVARNEFARIAPQVGDRVAVIYKGKTTRSDGPDFHSYRAKKVGGDAQPFNWGGEQQTATEDPTPSENGHDPTKASEPLKVADKNIPF